jgi:ketosteroid isomerase-like protein
LFCGLNLVAQKQNKEVNQVLANMKMQEESWNKGDVRGFMDYYWNNDSLKFIGSKGITYGWQKTLDNYIKGYPNKEAMGILTFTILESTQLSETSIYVIGKWELKKEKPSGGHFTLLWKKINNQWVIVADHTS